MTAAALQEHAHAPRHQAHPANLSVRAMAGLLGIFISAMMAGLNNRVGALGLADVRGALGFGLDDASWLTTFYAAGELIATPFATWFAITLSVRRFHLLMVSICAGIAALLPFVHDLNLLIGLRFLQGMSSGALIPVLMMAALKFLPPQIRLHGLALYAMTATFAPNLAMWLAGQWTDELFDWRWLYWQSIPLCVLAGVLVGWGLPHDKIQTRRFKEANWLGLAFGSAGLALLSIALDQGVRLDWFNSPLVTLSLVVGLTLFVIYLLTEWFHEAPFLKLQLLGRRNLWLGSSIFVLLLVTLVSGSQLPANYLGGIQGYRSFQTAPVGLLIALPQLVLGSMVAFLLYKKWVDARIVFVLGLSLIALACFSGAQLTAEWNRDQFLVTQLLQAFGQPMAIVSQLFLMTSVVHPNEGPYFSGTINTLRAFSSLIGGATIGQLLAVRSRFHSEMLLDRAAQASNWVAQSPDSTQLMNIVSQQSVVLSVADAYRVLGVLALLLIPLVLRLTYIPAPDLSATHPTPSPSSHG
ncbi:MFS transporter [Ferribacterium limneticum]|uniref:MFS transporter n=1 Tax=Ferribacterium limneticum TaxID=76259 RepID=UPI001CFB4642|nr:MFS transporter [Ferribacterium limneticum]UCV17809.1 MFS transporter [Ferribacterium limneticum]